MPLYMTETEFESMGGEYNGEIYKFNMDKKYILENGRF